MKKLLKNIFKPFLVLPITFCFVIGAVVMYCAYPFAWLYNKIYNPKS